MADENRSSELADPWQAVFLKMPLAAMLMRHEDPRDLGSFRVLATNVLWDIATKADPGIYVGQTLAVAFPSLLRTPAPAAYAKALDSQQTQRLPAIHYDGDGDIPPGDYDVTVVPLDDRHVAAFCVDISATLAAERLGQVDERYRALVDALPDLLFRLDAAGRFVDFKAPPGALLAAPAESIIGSNIRESPLPPGSHRSGVAGGRSYHRWRGPGGVQLRT